MSDLIGKSLGRYHILEQLGEGGMAIVYKAYDTRLETNVAVKVIRTDRLPPEVLQRALKRFEREAKALAQLTQPNIVKVLDYGEYEGQPYLIMPYLPGGTLKHTMRGRPIPWREATRLLMPVARALEFAHKRGMIHRDVKPSNILITDSGEPMLTDFGVAKIIDEESTMELTGTGVAVGTPEYMAPEQAVAKTVDHRADIYALGIVFYEMVTGRRPFQADTPLATLFKHASEPLPRPTSFLPSLPAAVEQMLLKLLAKDPNDRYQSMGEVEAALNNLVRDLPAQPAAEWNGKDAPDNRAGTSETKGSRTIAAGELAKSPPTQFEDLSRTVRVDVPSRKTGATYLKAGIAAATILFSIACLALCLVLVYAGTRGAGPLSMLATPTPTRTPRPTRTSTPTWTPSATSTITFTPKPSATSRPSHTPTPLPPPVTWYINSLGAKVTSLVFFEGGSPIPGKSSRVYKDSFSRTSTRYVYSELNLTYSRHGSKINFTITYSYFNLDTGDVYCKNATHNAYVEADWGSSWHVQGCGCSTAGSSSCLAVGSYRVDLYVGADRVASGYFSIY